MVAIIGRARPARDGARSRIPSGRRSPAASPCCRAALRASRWRTRSWAFDDGIDRAGLLAEAAIDAFRHVDVVARGAARAVLARFGLDGDRLGRANRLAQLASDAALLAVGI